MDSRTLATYDESASQAIFAIQEALKKYGECGNDENSLQEVTTVFPNATKAFVEGLTKVNQELLGHNQKGEYASLAYELGQMFGIYSWQIGTYSYNRNPFIDYLNQVGNEMASLEESMLLSDETREGSALAHLLLVHLHNRFRACTPYLPEGQKAMKPEVQDVLDICTDFWKMHGKTAEYEQFVNFLILSNEMDSRVLNLHLLISGDEENEEAESVEEEDLWTGEEYPLIHEEHLRTVYLTLVNSMRKLDRMTIRNCWFGVDSEQALIEMFFEEPENVGFQFNTVF